jgi:hypothetical protein
MLEPLLLAKAAENYDDIFVHEDAPGWFGCGGFMARGNVLYLGNVSLVQKPKLASHLRWFGVATNRVDRMQEDSDLREVPHDLDAFGGRFYSSPGFAGVGPGTTTKVQARFGDLLDGYEVFRMKPTDKDPVIAEWPLAGFQDGKLMVVVMPMRF